MFCRKVNQTIWVTKWIFKACAVSSLWRLNAVSDDYSQEGIFNLQHIGIIIPSTILCDFVEQEFNVSMGEFVCKAKFVRVICALEKMLCYWSNWMHPHIAVFLQFEDNSLSHLFAQICSWQAAYICVTTLASS